MGAELGKEIEGAAKETQKGDFRCLKFISRAHEFVPKSLMCLWSVRREHKRDAKSSTAPSVLGELLLAGRGGEVAAAKAPPVRQRRFADCCVELLGTRPLNIAATRFEESRQ